VTRQRDSTPLAVLVAAVISAALLSTSAAPVASAAEVELRNVTLAGPESPWRPVNRFDLTWTAVRSNEPGSAPYTVDYLIRDPSSVQVAPLGRFSPLHPELRGLQIPLTGGLETLPRGLYTLELWAEGSSKPHALVNLGFDDQPPRPARPIVPTGWLRAGSYAEIEIEHPAAPVPVSGIRGYAVLLDHSSAGEPCSGSDLCGAAETDLDAGIDDDAIQLGPLLEETNVVRVLAVSNSGLRSPLESAALHVDGTPPQLAFRGLPSGWSSQPVRVTAAATDPLSGTSADGPEGALTVISVDDDPPTVTLGGEAAVSVHGNGVHRLAATARDAVGNATDAAHPATAALRIDETPPQVSFAVARDPAEPERIIAAVDDPLSGPAARGTIAVRPDNSSQPFQALPTAWSAGHLTALWDSDAYPQGTYEFRATAYDVAGNQTSTELRGDGQPLVLPSPLKAPTAVSFGFGGRRLVWHRCTRRSGGIRCQRKVIVGFDRRPADRTVPFGHRVPVGGKLVSAAGAPLAGREVEVEETFGTGSSPRRRTTTVLTGADGVFLARLAPGPSRQISATFAGTRQLTRAAGRDLQLGIRARVGMRASSTTATVGGAPVVFNGKVDHQDAAIPSTGLAIELQFQVLESPWSEFRTVQTDAYGRFRYPYSFSDDDSRGIRFQVRAVIPKQPGWPYEAGTSRPVAVTGR
jgi:hypothetical protein